MKLVEILKSKVALLILLVAIIPTFKPLLRSGFFPMHDDVQAMRVLQMDKCLKDFQIPCRWVPDMGFGYGYPQFNYYSPLPYYLMESFHLIDLNFLDSVKAFFVFSILVSMIGMFYLGKEFWGIKGGILSALFYSFAPYYAYDLYVRGAVGELAAFAILPFIFLYTKRLVEGNKRSLLLLTLSFSALFTSHNITSTFFLPLTFVWFLYLSLFYFRLSPLLLKKILKGFLLSVIWGFGLSAFFVLPAIFEKVFVKTETLTYGYFNYVSHFVGLKQLLLNTFWGYGSSEPGQFDQAFLGIGILHWTLPLVAAFLLWYFRKNKELMLCVGLIFCGWLGLFMIHPRSVFIWDNIPLLSYFQFPWRFLILVIFLFSFAFGSLGLTLNGSKSYAFGIFLSLYFVLLIFYASYFRPSTWLNINDARKFSGESWQLQQTVSINDYLPVYAKEAPNKPAADQPEVVEGQAEFLDKSVGTDWQRWKIDVKSDNAQIRLQLFYFPGWKAWVDKEEKTINYDNKWGLITFNIEKGQHEIYAKLTNTPIRKLGNLVSLVGLVYIPFYLKKKN